MYLPAHDSVSVATTALTGLAARRRLVHRRLLGLAL
jgi:hypothetical protein